MKNVKYISEIISLLSLFFQQDMTLKKKFHFVPDLLTLKYIKRDEQNSNALCNYIMRYCFIAQ